MKRIKQLIRPTYSYMGDYKLTTKVIVDIVKHEAHKVRDVKVKDVRVARLKAGAGVTVEIDVILKFGVDIRETAKMVQRRVRPALEEYAALTVPNVNIKVLTFN